ncbi:MAG: hypothetical protein JNJ59_24655 [Deltaproteobacteria bacterium]|nr:hypothetical protein [Deltaproteobacteria bacterium]
MLVRSASIVTTLLVSSALGCSDQASGPSGPHLEIGVAPLTLNNVADACYTLTVYNVGKDAIGPSSVVWTKSSVCATRYGDARGSVSYIGTCDADPDGRINTTSLVLEGLCTTAGCDVSDPSDPGTLAVSEYQNPCKASKPCLLERPCRENADTLVEFNITIMRDAKQGFFDIAVNFEDIFCSAKLDCVPELLHRPGGERDLTAVLGFACTSGAETCLYADSITLTCDNGSWTIDPSQGPGNITENSPVLFAAATYEGDEAFTAFEKQYWNVALGLDSAAFAAAQNCTLSWSTTAAEGALTANTTPADTTYPRIVWSRQILTNGVLTCGAHALNEVKAGESAASVRTEYVQVDESHTFPHTNCEPEASGCVCELGFSPNPTGTSCVRELSVAPTQAGAALAVCAGDSNNAYSMLGARFAASATPSSFEYNDDGSSQTGALCTDPAVCLQVGGVGSPWVGRLSTVGVWSCQDTGAVLHKAPLNQWIGFSQCLNLNTAGDYLVGIAGDNRVLIRVDGVDFYESQSPLNFRSWNVLRIPLTAGSHVVELFGLNLNGPAAFGAEISGPFTPGSVSTPTQMAAADYLGNIVFSTANLRTGGATFQVSTGAGAASGLSCPDAFALNLCGETPTCTLHSELACGSEPAK